MTEVHPPEMAPPKQVLPNAEFGARVGELMRDKQFLVDTAFTCDKAYRDAAIASSVASGTPVEDYLKQPLFSDYEKATLLAGDTEKPGFAEAQRKLAMGIAPVYAVIDGVGLLARDGRTQHEVLNAVAQGTMGEDDANVLSRFAHTAWAAGQPFRGRETRPVMQPFDTLPPQEQMKDVVQVQAAANALAAKI